MRKTRHAAVLAILAIAEIVGGRSAATRAQQGGPYTDQQATAGQAGPIGTAGQNATRTMALFGNLLFYPATDATLYALDARTGTVVWTLDSIDSNNFVT